MKIREILPIDNVSPGAWLAEAVMDSAGRMLVPAGTELTGQMLDALKRRNIPALLVEREQDEDPAVQEARRHEIEQILSQRFQRAGEGAETRVLYQAVLTFCMERGL